MTAPAELPSGVFTASLTPLDANLAPDIPVLLEHSRWLLSAGCDGLGILGTTGEANSLGFHQRLRVIEATTAELPHDRLLIGTGSCSIGDAVGLTRASLGAGANNVLVVPPFYYKPVSDDGVFRFFAQLIEAVGDEALRVYLYNFPQMTAYNFSSEVIGRLRDAFGAVVAGMKDSSGKWENMRDISRAHPGFRVFAGTEQFLLDILREGGAGCISATANVTSRACQDVYQAWREDSPDTDALQSRLTAVRLAIQAHPAIPALKAMTEQATGSADWQRVLPPFGPVPAAALQTLLSQLTDLGFTGPGQSIQPTASN